MPSPFVESVMPVKPGELSFAMDLMNAAVAGRLPINSDRERLKYPWVIGMTALFEYIPEREKAKDLSMRVDAFGSMLRNPKSEEWIRAGQGTDGSRNVHGALWMAAAEMPLNDEGGFNEDEFFGRVREIAARHSLDDLGKALKDGYQELRDSCRQQPRTPPPQIAERFSDDGVYDDGLPVQQRIGIERIGRNDPCPCGSGKKYKKCHGAN